jgi:hypothetical protein
MKAVIRRLRKLEERFGPPVETASTRRLRARIEAGRRRLAEAQERGEWCGPVGDHHGENLAGLATIRQVASKHRGVKRDLSGVTRRHAGIRPHAPSRLWLGALDSKRAIF